MLTIKNYHKLFRQQIDVHWRVGEIFETSTAYLIQLMTIDGKKMQINLERNMIDNRYELWCWDKYTPIGVSNIARPHRTMLNKDNIKSMDWLMDKMEFLTRDIRKNY